MTVEPEVFGDAAQVAEAAAERIAAVVKANGHIALAGGSSPKRAYGLLRARGLDFGGATLWYSDDRAVGPDDERSNHRMVAEALLDGLPEELAPRAVHRIEGERGAEAAAEHYEALIRAELGDAPVFDLVLLGLGPDAHCASLFPGKPAIEVRDHLIAAVPEAGMEPYVPRVTFTLPLINDAREVLFMVSGADKAEAVARAFGDPADPVSPAAHVRPARVLLDEAAAAGLR
ncbi:MAG TPA: 6-phosphogluconolactonase [Solirubrobacteraceae bacterium]|jgi:6-phosphogluconolactonase